MRVVVAWMVEGDMDVFPVSLRSVEGADAFVVIDGNKDPDSSLCGYLDKVAGDVRIKHIPFPHDDKRADGIQRQNYLDLLIKNYSGDYCLVLDADEVVHDFSKVRELCVHMEQEGIVVASPRMRHFIGDFGHEDSTRDKHYVPFRLFKVQSDMKYTLHEHSVLTFDANNSPPVNSDHVVIWHINGARNITRLHSKYKNNLLKSPVHSRGFLDWWYHSQVVGVYPTAKVDPLDLPDVLTDFYSINKDIFYFSNRMDIEAKHWRDAYDWSNDLGIKSAFLLGCGAGMRVSCLNKLGVSAKGLELSEWAVANGHAPNDTVVGSVVDPDMPFFVSDLVVAYDLLEHLTKEELFVALANVKNACKKYFLVSVPFVGDPNLYNDKTHKVFESRDWWIDFIEKAGFKSVVVPDHWLYRHQLLLFEVVS